MIILTGLWKKKDGKGNTFLVGKLNGNPVLVLPNSFKTNDNQPDYNLCLAPRENDGKKGETKDKDDLPF